MNDEKIFANIEDLICNMALRPLDKEREVFCIHLTETQDIIVLPYNYIFRNYSGAEVQKLFTYAFRTFGTYGSCKPASMISSVNKTNSILFRFA